MTVWRLVSRGHGILPLVLLLVGCATLDTPEIDRLVGPKWQIQQASFPDQRYRLTLRMDRIYAGGAGEARAVFHHRAEELMRQNGYDGYQVIEYTESLDSSIVASQRMAQGTIQLTRK
jgi:hypothetical protein